MQELDVLSIISQLRRNYKQKNGEAVFTYCPFCNGGSHKDKETFSVNISTGLYSCKRGKCSEKGNIRQLAEKFKIDISDYKESLPITTTPKKYKEPTDITHKPNQRIYDYFSNRKISKDIIDLAEIKMTNKGWVSFEYKDETGKLSFRKYKNTKQKMAMAESGTKPIFYMMDKIESFESLIITEGEEDCLAIWESGYENATSVPTGSKGMSFLENCWDWVQKFKKIIIWSDSDDAGVECRNEIGKRLDKNRCLYVDCDRYKDANDVLRNEGFEGVVKAIDSAKPFPVSEINNASDIDIYSYENTERVKSFFKFINRETEGGFRRGEVIMWTGFTACGKSTIVSLEALNHVKQDERVCLYSSESTNKKYMTNLYKQASGKERMKKEYNHEYEKEEGFLLKRNVELISSFISHKLFIVRDGFEQDYEKLLEVFKKVYYRYGIKNFFIDNMMTLIPYSDQLHALQTKFLLDAQTFVKTFGVTLHIVAHQRKPPQSDKKQYPTKYGVLGSSNIPNLVDVMIGVYKNIPSEDDSSHASLLMLKERETGSEDTMESYFFEPISKRFSHNWNNINYNIGWEK